MGMEEFVVSLTNRSIRTIKTELEFLANNSVIARQQVETILNQLPEETSLDDLSIPTTAVAAATSTPSLPYRNPTNGTTTSSNSISEKQPLPPAYQQNSLAPQPAPTAPASPPALAHAVALYAYAGTDSGDLAFQANDHIAVVEYVNADWWKGRNERSGAVGIFPRNYVRLEEKGLSQQQPPRESNYGNMPLDVSQQQPQQQPQGKSTASKIGGKLGNAALFGAGATFGGNIVNSIF